MLKLILNKLLGKTKRVIKLEYNNRQVRQIRRAIAEGFKVIWNGAVWVLTKVVYL